MYIVGIVISLMAMIVIYENNILGINKMLMEYTKSKEFSSLVILSASIVWPVLVILFLIILITSISKK